MEDQINEIMSYITIELGIDLGKNEKRVREMLKKLVQDTTSETIYKAVDLITDLELS